MHTVLYRELVSSRDLLIGVCVCVCVCVCVSCALYYNELEFIILNVQRLYLFKLDQCLCFYAVLTASAILYHSNRIVLVLIEHGYVIIIMLIRSRVHYCNYLVIYNLAVYTVCT